MSQTNQSAPESRTPMMYGATYGVTSMDPIVAEVHAIRAKEWNQYGENSQAWFDALLHRQAQRMQQPVS